jgi:hypothetical protein
MKDRFSQDFICMLRTNDRSISDMPSCLAFPHGMHPKSSICLCCFFACHVQALYISLHSMHIYIYLFMHYFNCSFFSFSFFI